MRWLNSFSLVMRSNLTTLRERFEDPERMIHQLLIDMEEELDRVRDSVAGAIADEIQLGKKVAKVRREVEHWTARATSAVQRGDDEQGRAAVEQKVLAQERAERLDDEYGKQKEQTAKLREAVGDLEDKIRQARQKQTLLLARMARADSTSKINRALDCTHQKSAFAQFGRLEQRVERAEAMSEAYTRLEGRDPDADKLEREFEESERKERLETEFEALKQRVKDETD